MRVMLDGWMGTNMRRRKKSRMTYFFAHWHSTAQTSRQPDDFSHKGLEGEILLQHDPSQDGFQLWNTRTCRRIKGFCLQIRVRGGGGGGSSRIGQRGGALPMACGETRWQKSEANTTRIMGYVTQARYWKGTLPLSSPCIHL